MELSKRLQAVADLLNVEDESWISQNQGKECNQITVADVGCDHGYIPIYLVEHKKVVHAIAMDVNQGPLEKAKEHINNHKMSTYIETRLSDGLSALGQGEANVVMIAGMGGGLVLRILEQGRNLWDSIDGFILQPQSEIGKVRTYLWEQGFTFAAENMVLEDGKYYPMMRVAYRGNISNENKPRYSDVDLEYGPILLRNAHPVLEQFLEREMHLKESVLWSLQDKAGSHITDRITDLTAEIRRAKDALQRYYQ